MQHSNPWSKDSGFIFLDTIRHGVPGTRGTYDTLTIDLYAIECPDTVHFGARFSDEPSDYESGQWFRLTDKLYVGRWTAQAAALYFKRKLMEKRT